ncbi:GNAT family N-acetyltransferase [Terricaulis sp.]|uniref:GNAT family N-acetyltransferase n=1 Tax=Terricaulis sp. TaxID=2768686 RepID=UPI003784B200
MHARQLTVADLAAYRALHRFALQEAPFAFVETLANDDARPDAPIADMLARGEGWGVFEGERLLGKLVIDTLPYACFSHTRWLHAIYLHPDGRGTGAGVMLMTAAMAQAQHEGALRFLLWVNEKNAAARGFYEKLGFREIGRVDKGIAAPGGGFVDDVMMCRALPLREA